MKSRETVRTKRTSAQPEVSICEDSLQNRRTATAKFGEIELGLRDNSFVTQQANRRKHRSGLTGTWRRDWRYALRRKSSRMTDPVRKGWLWVDSAVAVHNIRDRQSQADHFAHTRIRLGFLLRD